MSLYQFSKSKITGFSASLLVVIALLTAFASIFHIVPPSLTLAVTIVRWILAGTLVFVWVILNIPPPKLPSGNYIIGLALLGEEEYEGGAHEGLLRAARRYRLRREDVEDYVDDDEVTLPISKRILQMQSERGRRSRGNLAAARANQALPSGSTLPAKDGTTALALSERKISVSAAEMRDLSNFAPRSARSEVALFDDMDEDTGLVRRNTTTTFAKFTPPPKLWEQILGPRAVTDFLDQAVKRNLNEVGLTDVSIYPTNTFVGDAEVAMQQAELVRAHAMIWGWVPFHSRRDFVPIFELVKAVEEDKPAPGEMQLLGLNSFDLGRQTAKFGTITAAFVAGLGAYAVKKAHRNEAEQSLAKAENEFGLALTAAYMYSEERRTKHTVDLSIIYFFLGNVRYYRGNLNGAAAAYREVLALDARMLEARHNLAVVLFAQNKLDLAIKFLTEVAKRQPNLAAIHYNLGMAYIKKQQFAKGRQELNEAIRRNPKYAAAYRALGLSYREENAYSEAKNYFLEAARIKPDYAQAHIDLAITCYREARSDGVSEAESVKLYREATTEIEKAIEIDPNLPEAHYNFAVFLYEQQEIDPAAESLKEALRLNPDYSEAHLLLSEIYRYRGQSDLADYHARQATRQSDLTATSPEQHISLGIGYRQNQQYEKARQEFEMVLKVEPNQPQALLQMGILYQEMGELNQALLRYQAVTRLPNPPDEVYNQISSLYKLQGDDEAAFEVIKRAAEINPNNARLQYYLGNAYRKQKQDGRAIESYVNSIRLNPNQDEARFNLGMLYLGRRQVQDAVFQFREVVRLRPDDFETYSFLGRSYQQLNQIDEAVAALKEAIRIRPEAVEARLSLGQIYLKSLAVPEPQLAIEQFQQVLSYRPDNAIARELLGRAYAQDGKLEMAIDTFQSILTSDTHNSAAHYNLGVAFTSQERFGLAAQEFEAYIRLKPDDADGYFNLGLAYNKLDRVNEAIASFKKTVQLRPAYCDAYNYLGQVYIRINDNASALEALNMFQRCKNGNI